MAAPTTPTLATITAEGLKKAGYASGTTQYTTALTRAQNEWAEEIKHDIWQLVKNPRYLQKTAVIPVTGYKSKYQFPSDFAEAIRLTLLESGVTGTAQDGAASTITLVSTDTHDAAFMKGKEIVITGGTGANQIRQIYDYNSTTKVATVDQSWATNPSSDSTYMIVENYYPLDEETIWRFDLEAHPDTPGRPVRYYPEGEKTAGATVANMTGEFIMIPTPDSVSTYAVKVRYYVDLLKLDLDTSTDVTIGLVYRRFRNIFVQGVYVKALQDQDDSRYQTELIVYDRLLKQLQARETYGHDLHNIVQTVGD